jgi:hypothetical protein
VILAPLLFADNPWANVVLQMMKQKVIGKTMHIFLRLCEKVTLLATPINAFDKLTKSESSEEDCMTSSKNTGLNQSSPRTKTARNYSTWAEILSGFHPQSSDLEPHPVSHFL